MDLVNIIVFPIISALFASISTINITCSGITTIPCSIPNAASELQDYNMLWHIHIHSCAERLRAALKGWGGPGNEGCFWPTKHVPSMCSERGLGMGYQLILNVRVRASVYVCVCYFSGRIGMVHGFPTNSALASGMCWWSVAPCLTARHCCWSKTKESGELNCREWDHQFFPPYLWPGADRTWSMAGKWYTTHLISSHAYSDQLSTHPITSYHPMCPWQLARSYHASNTVYTHTLTHVHTLTQWGSSFLPPSDWPIQGQCSGKVCIQVKNKGKQTSLEA